MKPSAIRTPPALATASRNPTAQWCSDEEQCGGGVVRDLLDDIPRVLVGEQFEAFGAGLGTKHSADLHALFTLDTETNEFVAPTSLPPSSRCRRRPRRSRQSFSWLASHLRCSSGTPSAVLGRVCRRQVHDTDRHPDAYLVPSLLLFRFDCTHLLANVGVLR